jgi:hypothetical protein
MIELMPHQEEAVEKLDNGKILWGGVGTGKSLAVLAYYMEKEYGRDIVVITTAKKRDSLEWEGEAAKFGISTAQELTNSGSLIVESWNNIAKFEKMRDCFFIFDEQRLVGSGAWVRSFLKIARYNRWVLLSATPGDTWMDYVPVFVANGYYKNLTDFKSKHVIYEAFTKYPKIKMFLGERHLENLRNKVLVEMPFITHTERILNWLEPNYDKEKFDDVLKRRWNPYEEQPVKDIAEMFRLMRRVVNADPSRIELVEMLMDCHPRLVIFYNFNYELELLRGLRDQTEVYEWNGHRKDPLPTGPCWIYLVQYAAGAEGWNCTTTNAMVLYSLTYSYKNFIQAQGRIDRLDTPYTELYYYILASNSVIDRGIKTALTSKKNFNERKFAHERAKAASIFKYL